MALLSFLTVNSSLQKKLRRSQHARKETEFLRLKRTRLGLDDFESLKVIGRGAFGEVCNFVLLHRRFCFGVFSCKIRFTEQFCTLDGGNDEGIAL